MLRKITVLGLASGLSLPAIAADKSWNTGAGAWNVAGHWTPAGLPGPADVVFIGNMPGVSNSVVTMNATVTIAALAITDGMQLDTAHRSIEVLGPVAVSGENIVGSASYPSTLRIESVDGLPFEAQDVTLSSGGVMWIDGAYPRINDVLTIGADSRMSGDGVLDLSGNGARSLINDGMIDPHTDGLMIRQFGTGLIDLDGNSGNGRVGITTHNFVTGAVDFFTIDGTALADPFDGEILMRNEAVLNMNLDEGWTLGPNGLLDLVAGSETVGPGRITGGQMTIAGNIDVSWSGALAQIESAARVESSAAISIGGGGRLTFMGETDVRGGVFQTAGSGEIFFSGPTAWSGSPTITGQARQIGDASVAASASVTADTFDIDGDGTTVWAITAPLTLTTSYLNAGDNSFYGSMDIGGGLIGGLAVHLPAGESWQMRGAMELRGEPLIYPNRLSGSRVELFGTLEVLNGRASIGADVDMGQTGLVTIPAGATLRVMGRTEIDAGAEFAGTGTLRNGQPGRMVLGAGSSTAQVGLVNDGLLDVAKGIGTATVPSFQNLAAGALRVDIAGFLPGSQHDQLTVVGAATLAGSLNISHEQIADAFLPQVDDEFVLLTAGGGVSGAFEPDPRSFRWGHYYDWTILYAPGSVTVRMVGGGVCPPGDVNDDGVIDLADLATILINFGMTGGGTWSQGDLNGDANVDLVDLATLLTNFGSSC